MFSYKTTCSILFKVTAITLVCLFISNDISWASQYLPDLAAEQSTLAAESRIKPFFEKHGLEFQNMAIVIMVTGKLKSLILEKKMHAGPLYREIEGLNQILYNDDIEIEKQTKTDIFKCSGREYKYATFYFKKENKKIKVLFFENHADLTTDELAELRIDNAEKHHLACPRLEGVWFISPAAKIKLVDRTQIPTPEISCKDVNALPGTQSGEKTLLTESGPSLNSESAATSDTDVKYYIGSPEGLGKAGREGPVLNTPIRRKALTRDGNLREIEVILKSRLGSGLSCVVYKGIYNEKEMVEKFSGDLPVETKVKSFAKKIMEWIYFLFRQASPPYRTNFYAAMTNHYASLIIEDASEFELGESIIPLLLYTSYDEKSGGYVMAYEYINGRHIRPGPEERLLREYLKKCKNFIADKLGFWGLARQCDTKSLNSPGNVIVIDEATGKMKLIDVTPGVLGGQIWILPIELEYFFKGLFTGNFLPFGDAVDIDKLSGYREELRANFSQRFDSARLKKFENNCTSFEFYLNKWRESEPAVLRSPFRMLAYLFNKSTIKSTLITTITALEYKGVIDIKIADALRQETLTTNRRIVLTSLRFRLFILLFYHIFYHIPHYIWKTARFISVGVLWKGFEDIKKVLIYTIKIYGSKEYRIRVSKEYIEKIIKKAEETDKRISSAEAKVLHQELEKEDILGMLELLPLWTSIKFITWPLFGGTGDILWLSLFIVTYNPYWLIPIFIDGVLRGIITIIFTGLNYKPLLILSFIPKIGNYVAIPTQLMKDAPHLSEFLMKEVVGSKIGTSVPGVSKHSFREYFYIRLMGIPLFFMRQMAQIVSRFDKEDSMSTSKSVSRDIDTKISAATMSGNITSIIKTPVGEKLQITGMVTKEPVSLTAKPGFQRDGPARAANERRESPLFVLSKKEADRIHIENIEYTPAVLQKTILCHIIADSILPDSQRNMLRMLAKNMRNENYSEKVISFSVNDPNDFINEIEALIAKQREEYKDYVVEFDIACPNISLVKAILGKNLGIKALAFETCRDSGLNAMIQVEGIVLALRALHSGRVESLQKAFRIVTGDELSPELSSIIDADEFARKIIFILPVTKTMDYSESRRLGNIMKENIEVAA